MARLLKRHEKAVADAAGVAVGGNRHTDLALADQVDAAIRTEHERAAYIGAAGSQVGAVENAGGAGRPGLDGGDEDIDATAPSIGSHEKAVADAAGVAGGGNRHTDLAVAAQVDAAIRTEHERAADIGAAGSQVGAVENAGGAGRPGLDGILY